MVTEQQIKLARDKFKEISGITIYTPDEGSLDDFEQSRYEGLVAALEAALSAAEPVAWQPRYKQEVIDHHKSIGSDLCEYAMTVYPTKEQAQGYGYGGHECRALYAEPQPAPSVAVKALEWKEDGKYLRARMGDREYSLNITSDGETWAGCTRPYVFGHNLTWSSVPNCSMVSLEQAKAACQADCQSRYAALSAQVQDVAGWLPIESAPRDGTVILIRTKGGCVSCGWDSSCQEWLAGWIGVGIPNRQALGWMPPPAAPAKQEG